MRSALIIKAERVRVLVKRCRAHFGESFSLVETRAGSDGNGDQRAALVKLSGETRGRSAFEPLKPRAHLPAIGFETCARGKRDSYLEGQI